MFCCCLPGLACAQADGIPFNLDQPTLISSLPAELEEISGLSMAHDRDDELLAVQDEEGKVYRINAAGQVLWGINFWKDGDYEGVEAVGEDIWVSKNTGTLYQITRAGQPDQHVEKYNTRLNEENDVEGLAYDAARNRLLLACKRDAKDDGNDKDGRYIFAFDLESKSLIEDPVYSIRRKQVNQFLNQMEACPLRQYLLEFFSEEEKYDLAPSALAIQPGTGNLYLVSSHGKVLMVLSPEGRLLNVARLPKEFFPQPEGLAFAKDGSLYISTEARGKARARIFRLPLIR
ncbi:hypothetical protein A3850_006655 [Lewinella sp. 4G2]|nr:hypothetical protein A3850_006655 [Lewinella sp. 4G2]